MGAKTVRKKQRTLTEADLLPGDHIWVKRKGGFYRHHGVYMGDGKVIHFTGSIKEKKDPIVQKTDLHSFLKGGTLRRREYMKRLPASKTFHIAEQKLTSGGYAMIWNNCEHFATYCATGENKSRQVRTAFSGLSMAAVGVLVFAVTRVVKSIVRKP